MATVRYFYLVREMKSACNHRLRLVESARDLGITQTDCAALCHHRAHRSQGSPSLPAARPFRVARAFPRAPRIVLPVLGRAEHFLDLFGLAWLGLKH